LKRTNIFDAHVLKWIFEIFIVLNILLFSVLLAIFWRRIITSVIDLDFKITTVFFLLFSSFIRLIILGQGDYSCLQYIHFPVSKKTILLSHILINLMNPVWMLIILWITIIGFKESFLNREWISFLIWMVQISLISIMFEMGIMLVTQVFKKKNLPEFLLSSIILSFYWIISSMVFLFKCNEIIRIGILISLAIPFVFRFLHSMQQVLLLDFHEWRCGCSGKWISMKWFGLNNTYFPLQFQILNRNHGLRNDCALGILITVLSIFFHQFIVKEPLSTVHAFWTSFFCAGGYFTLRYLQFISWMDRKSSGFYLVQPVPVSSLIHSRVLAVDLFYGVLILLNIVRFLLHPSLIPIMSISLSIFMMGTLSYCIFNGQNLRFDAEMPQTELTMMNINPAILLPIIILHISLFFLIHVLFGDIFILRRLQDFWKPAVPGTIGLAGLLFQRRWIEIVGKKWSNPL